MKQRFWYVGMLVTLAFLVVTALPLMAGHDNPAQAQATAKLTIQKTMTTSAARVTRSEVSSKLTMKPIVRAKSVSNGNATLSGAMEDQPVTMSRCEGVQYAFADGDKMPTELDPDIPVNMKLPREHSADEPSRDQIFKEMDQRLDRTLPGNTDFYQDAGDPSTPPTNLIQIGGLRASPGETDSGWADYPPGAVYGGPPDTDLSVGSNHIISDYNSYYEVFDKSGTSLLTRNLTTLFSGLTYCAGAGSVCDPQSTYDDENGIHVITALAAHSAGSDSKICLAVSIGDTAIGSWHVYELDPPGTGVADYPHTGIGEDAIFVGWNWFGATNYSQVMAIDKTKAYNGTLTGSDTAVASSIGSNAPDPAERRGFAQGQYPPSGTPHYIATGDGSGNIDLYRWPQPTLTSSPSIQYGDIMAYPGGCNNPSGATYTDTPIDCIDFRPFDIEMRWPYVWVVRVGDDASSNNTIQWAQYNVQTGTYVQGAEYGVSGDHLWMPDGTVDKEQNYAIVYSRADETMFVSSYVSGRESGDPLNNMGAPVLQQAGTQRYTSGIEQNGYYRWGDYMGAAVDPNGCDIWMNGMWVGTVSGADQAKTWISKWQFPSCSVSNGLLLDKGKYGCNDSMTITLQDETPMTAAEVAAAVTITTATDTENTVSGDWTDISGTGIEWQATFPVLGSAGANDDGTINFVPDDTVTVTYLDAHPAHPDQIRTAEASCSASVATAGYLIDGGCDEGLPQETYTEYMDAGEFNALTLGFVNNEAMDLTDVTCALSVSGAGASYITIYNPSVYVGTVLQGETSGAVFDIYVDPSCPGMTSCDFNMDVSSPADGYATGTILTWTLYLHADDNLNTEVQCYTHKSMDMYDSVVSGYVANPWAFRSTITGEDRGDCPNCGSTAAGTITTGIVGTKCARSQCFAGGADSILLNSFHPTYHGTAPNGQPYYYSFIRHSFFTDLEVPDDLSGAWGLFWNNNWNMDGASTTADNVLSFPYMFGGGYYYHTIFDWTGNPGGFTFDTAEAGTCDDWAGTYPPNQFWFTFRWYDYMEGEATSNIYFAFGHEHWDIDGSVTNNYGDVGINNDQLIYDQWWTEAQTLPSCPTGQVGAISWDQYSYSDCPETMATVTVWDDNAVGPLTATVNSVGTTDSETLTLTGTGPYFSATITLSTLWGANPDDGRLFVLANEYFGLEAHYTDASPVGTSDAYAHTEMNSVSLAIIDRTTTDNGDDDGYPDTNETFEFVLTLENSGAADLTNVHVEVEAVVACDWIDCMINTEADFGTITASGGTGNNAGDPFIFHVDPTYECSDPVTPDMARFAVHITADGACGTDANMRTSFVLDVDSSKRSTDADSPILATYYKNKPTKGSSHPKPYTHLLAERTKPVPSSTRDTTDGNAWYHDTLIYDGVYYFGGGYAGNPDYMVGTLFDPTDFGILTPYEVQQVIFAQEMEFGGDEPTAWFIYADAGGVPGTQLENGEKNWGISANHPDIDDIVPATQLGAGERFWLFMRGDPLYAGSYDLIWEYDSDNSGHSYSSVTGPAGLSVDSYENIYSATIASTVSYVCDTTDNSGLPDPCGCTVTVDVTPDGTTTVNVGDTIIYSVVAAGGTGWYTYQWTEDGVDMTGETTDQLIVSYLSAQSHDYNCKVNDDSCNCIDIEDAADSTGTWQSVGCDLVVNVTPDSSTVCAGADIVFTAGTTGGTAPFTYQWYEDAGPIAGATDATYTANYGASAVHTYNCYVSDSGDCTDIFDVGDSLGEWYDPLTVDVTPDGTTAVCANTDIIFTATPAGGDGAYTYQWTEDAAPIAGATDATYTANYAAAATHDYNCEVNDGAGCGPVTDASDATGQWYDGLTVDVTPDGLTQVNVGLDILFTATPAGGDGAYTYQWFEDGGSIAGATDATYTANYGTPQSHLYNCEVNDGAACGPVTDIADSTGEWIVGSVPPPPPGDGVTGSAMTLTKVSGDTLHVVYDVATCNADHAVMLYGALGTFDAYTGEVTAGCDVGATGAADFDIVADNVWFNLVWANGSDVGGHPGFATAGDRAMPATGFCSVASDDFSDDICD